MNYLDRIADQQLKERLAAFGAVLIEGPKWCGKTTTASMAAKSTVYLQDPDLREEYLETARLRPSYLLEGEKPRLIDEWQDVSNIWDSVRHSVDRLGENGLYILTGSNTIDKSKILHSGIGRISRMQMLPMSLWESKESNGSISLKELVSNPKAEYYAKSDMDLEDLIYAACRGGWPGAVKQGNCKSGLMVAQDYVKSLCEMDLGRNASFECHPRVAMAVLKSYARNISTLAKKSSLLADLEQSGETDISRHRLDSYLEALEKLFIICDVEPWCPAIRSSSNLRSAPKRSFVDPSIAAAALGLSPASLKLQLKTFGFIFEQMCLRDLRAYTGQPTESIKHYRDRYGLEADAVVHFENGRYALVEIKLGQAGIDEGAAHLLKLRRIIKEHNETEKQVPIPEPDLLLVITGGQTAYPRPDGVHVVPLACLKP